MIEMQYNFPLLPAQGKQWQTRLAAAVASLTPSNTDQLRPTFRSSHHDLRAIAAAWLHSDPANTWITCGGHHSSLISLLAAGLAGKPIAVETITYTGIIDQARMLACPLTGIAYDAEGMLPEALAEACRAATAAGKPIAATYLMPNAHNPLGCTASLARREAIVAVCRTHDLLILQDDAYGYMVLNPPLSYAALAPERTFYIRGLSKSYASATCTGLLVAPARFSAPIQNAIKSSTTGTALPLNVAALSMVADGTLDTLIAEKLTEGAIRNSAARDLFAAAGLSHHAVPGVPNAWHLWVTLPTPSATSKGTTPQAFEALMASRSVALSGGNWFAVAPDPGQGVRLALGGELDPARTLLGVQRVVEALSELSRSA
jgi:DNA-binding transcriptional MocR family regulator